MSLEATLENTDLIVGLHTRNEKEAAGLAETMEISQHTYFECAVLYKLWRQTYKSAMKAEDLDSTPITFTDEEALWCKKCIESLQRLRTDAQREERGLPTGLRRGTARTKKSAQDKAAAAAAAAAAGQGAQDSVGRRAAAEMSDDSDVAPGLKVPRR